VEESPTGGRDPASKLEISTISHSHMVAENSLARGQSEEARRAKALGQEGQKQARFKHRTKVLRHSASVCTDMNWMIP
jgi:hypothetical protein